MNDTWNFLREFESKELLKRYYQKRFGRQLNSEKAYEISSAFIQGREYFNSYTTANIAVQPLLLYYGVVSLSRGLILILNRSSRETSLKGSHGLQISNWHEVSKSKEYDKLKLVSCGGTFIELIEATENKTYIRNGTDFINARIRYASPSKEIQISLTDIAYGLPDLLPTIESWLNKDVPVRQLKEWFRTEGDKKVLTLYEHDKREIIEQIFPNTSFNDLTIQLESQFSKISFKKDDKLPKIVQKWISTFEILGDPYVTPPLENGDCINDISLLYAASYSLGMMSRYYPSAWNNINKNIHNDSIYPFAINLMSFLEKIYPKIVLDFLNSPHEVDRVSESKS